MANRTAKEASSVKGTNPQYLIEKVIRMRIYDSRYWKEECFALSAELIVDKGMELRFIGGVYGGNTKPTPFLCLVLKMLQIQPDKDIVIEFIRQEDSKYIRALGALYMRLTASYVEVYKYLEPLFNDYRKLRWMNKTGTFEILHMDEFIDKLLRDETMCDIQLPRLQKRELLEETGALEPRVSALEEDLENISSSSEDEGEKNHPPRDRNMKKPPERRKSPLPRRRRSRSLSYGRERDHERDRRRRSRSRERRSSDRSGRREKRRERSDHRKDRESSNEREIREANELRAKLGLNPLE